MNYHFVFISVFYNLLKDQRKLNDTRVITYDLIEMICKMFGTINRIEMQRLTTISECLTISIIIFLECSGDGGGLAALANSVYWTQGEMESGEFKRLIPGLIDVRRSNFSNDFDDANHRK